MVPLQVTAYVGEIETTVYLCGLGSGTEHSFLIRGPRSLLLLHRMFSHDQKHNEMVLSGKEYSR